MRPGDPGNREVRIARWRCDDLMSLRERLQRIRGASSQADEGGTPGRAHDHEPPARALASLAERLGRLQVGRPRTMAGQAGDTARLIELLGASEIVPGVLCLERRVRAAHRHGRFALSSGEGVHPAAQVDPGWVRAPQTVRLGEAVDECAQGCPAEVVCLDTETSGLAGGTGTWAFLTGVLRWRDKGWCLRQWLLTRLDAEGAYLEAVASDLAGAGLIVSYNGLSFDAPLLATRFRLAGQADPLALLPHLDLLRPVRRAFARVWPDCRLISVERRLLNFARSHDLPGQEAPAAWLAWLRHGETQALAGVLRHNRWDLFSLAALLSPIAQVFEDPGAYAADVRAVADYHRIQGRPQQALRLLRAHRSGLDDAGLWDLACLVRRDQQWEEACRIWETLAARGDVRARIELAKYHEHQTRDLARALLITSDLPPGALRDTRRARLLTKLKARAAASESSFLGSGDGILRS